MLPPSFHHNELHLLILSSLHLLILSSRHLPILSSLHRLILSSLHLLILSSLHLLVLSSLHLLTLSILSPPFICSLSHLKMFSSFHLFILSPSYLVAATLATPTVLTSHRLYSTIWTLLIFDGPETPFDFICSACYATVMSVHYGPYHPPNRPWEEGSLLSSLCGLGGLGV